MWEVVGCLEGGRAVARPEVDMSATSVATRENSFIVREVIVQGDLELWM